MVIAYRMTDGRIIHPECRVRTCADAAQRRGSAAGGEKTMTAKQTPKPAKSASPRAKRRSAERGRAASPFSFAKWWQKTGRWMARNPEVAPRFLAAEAWRAGQQNKLVLPNADVTGLAPAQENEK
jgi:hypothetical protein